MQRIDGVVQHYAWGDHTFIPEMLGVEPDGTPWAELWLGTHPSGPSRLDDGRLLAEVTGPLPYLLKVLAAAEPLSLQTHPDAEQARAGFARGIFPDDQPKPELLVALTPFEALCGFRPIAETLALLDELGSGGRDIARSLAEDGAAATLDGIYHRTIDTHRVVEACRAASRPVTDWIVRLDSRYPGDPSVIVALLLNHVVLAPGEALRLDAGHLHAYLVGAGIELMGASDNVVRAGLTIKPVDVDEVLRIVDTTPIVDPVLPDTGSYALPATGVRLQRIQPGEEHTATMHELVIGSDGVAGYLAPGTSFAPEAIAFVVTALDPSSGASDDADPVAVSLP